MAKQAANRHRVEVVHRHQKARQKNHHVIRSIQKYHAIIAKIRQHQMITIKRIRQHQMVNRIVVVFVWCDS